ncbi:ABC transporter substrate-binding protein [Aequorivita sp. Q41]|uniref:ABC transporter substrate-binding protein n=1 Tax=Aequorivita sp. Q41 TaxID=3153300 RepID=UPI003242996F
MQKIVFLLTTIIVLAACKNTNSNDSVESVVSSGEKITEIKYANGFEIRSFGNYKTISLKNPWPGTDKTFTYALVEKGTTPPNAENFDAIVEMPIKRIVVTSTTHIPSLEMLDETNSLVGFPNLDYISSEKTRKNIGKGKITELGRNEAINTEILIDLKPDAVIGFAIDGNNSTFNTIEKLGVPVLYNSDWTETSPLGKAEWIKFFGVLFNKEKKADSIFKTIETAYITAKKIASQAKTKPTVISGAMYKDVWYIPQGDSWGAQFIADANGDYLWQDTKGTGSLSLNLESVLEKGYEAEFWIGPGQFTNFDEMKNASKAYAQFKAFKNGNVFTYSLKKGETGGVIYFELAPNRPDLVLKDLIKILHPELFTEYELYFFDKLQ